MVYGSASRQYVTTHGRAGAQLKRESSNPSKLLIVLSHNPWFVNKWTNVCVSGREIINASLSVSRTSRALRARNRSMPLTSKELWQSGPTIHDFLRRKSTCIKNQHEHGNTSRHTTKPTFSACWLRKKKELFCRWSFCRFFLMERRVFGSKMINSKMVSGLVRGQCCCSFVVFCVF